MQLVGSFLWEISFSLQKVSLLMKSTELAAPGGRSLRRVRHADFSQARHLSPQSFTLVLILSPLTQFHVMHRLATAHSQLSSRRTQMLWEWALETSLKIDNTKDDSKIRHLQVTQPGTATYTHGGTATSLSKCKARAASLILFLQERHQHGCIH